MKRTRDQLELDLALVLKYTNDSYHANPTDTGIKVGEAIGRLKEDLFGSIDECEVCGGAKGGEPGNENYIRVQGGYVLMCDSCRDERD